MRTSRFEIPTAQAPDDPKGLYVRVTYDGFFYGPFKNEGELVAALRTLDKVDPQWDEYGFHIHRGDPTSDDWVNKLPFVTVDDRERIEAARRAK